MRVRAPPAAPRRPAAPGRRWARIRVGVHRPAAGHPGPLAHRFAGRPGRAAFVSGKRKQNTIKTTTISDGQGRTLWCGAVRPGRMHDQTAMRTGASLNSSGSAHA